MRQVRHTTGGGSNRKFSGAGKVVLAAVVHKDTICGGGHLSSGGQYEPTNEDCNNSDGNSFDRLSEKSSNKKESGRSRNEKSRNKKQEKANTYTDDKEQIGSLATTTKRKFSNLFSSKKKQQNTRVKQEQEEVAKKVIDGEQEITNDLPANSITAAGCKKRDLDQAAGCIDDHQVSSAQQREREQQAEVANGQVIEFRLDLIVDAESERDGAIGFRSPPEGERAISGAEIGGGGQKVDEEADCSERLKQEQEDETMERKLNDNVNELVESFVLDSNDVCLMSIGEQKKRNYYYYGETGDHLAAEREEQAAGKKRRRRSGDELGIKLADEFNYLSQLAAHTLAYSFHLLESAAAEVDEPRNNNKEDNTFDSHQKNPFPRSTNEAASSNYSIELSATLFLCKSSDQCERDEDDDKSSSFDQEDPTSSCDAPSLDIIDLLAGDQATENEAPNQQRAADCVTLKQALAAMDKIRSRLEQVDGNPEKKSLLIGLKLEQRINGGLFSNRMCLVDFRPKFCELEPIFKSIFSGQALAYLKGQKFRSLQHNGSLGSGLEGDSLASIEINKHNNHRVASQTRDYANKLVQAEWLFYKQLSSALIRTLLIVHVHKLSTTSAAGKQQQPPLNEAAQFHDHERRVMADNLLLLEFARSIQRASDLRLKRRKRHLKSHLASSQVSVASNASATTTTANERTLVANRSPYRRGSSRSPQGNGHNHSSRHYHRHLSHQAAANHLPHGYHNTTSSYNRKASLDMNLALARHHHRNRNRSAVSGGGHHLLRATSGGCYSGHSRSSRYDTSRRNANRTAQQFYLPDLCTTESSSMSTSSGSQKMSCKSSRHHNNRINHNRENGYCATLAAGNQRKNNNSSTSYLNNLSDSDSVTSANLNSCSSSSQYNRLVSATNERLAARGCDDSSWLADGSTMRSPLSPMSSPMIEMSHMKSPLRIDSRSICGGRRTIQRKPSESIEVAAQELGPRASSVIQIDCQSPVAAAERKRSSAAILQADVTCDLRLSASGQSHHNTSSQTLKFSGRQTQMSQNGATNSNLEPDSRHLHPEDIGEDNVSDICSVVIAEPPKQLKLEEFLNQLSGIIGHKRADGARDDSTANGPFIGRLAQVQVNGASHAAPEDAFKCPDGFDSEDIEGIEDIDVMKADEGINCSNWEGKRQANDRHLTSKSVEDGSCATMTTPAAYEDDEDCKSHSSILEHLSTLALESNTKLNNRQQSREPAVGCPFRAQDDAPTLQLRKQYPLNINQHDIVLRSSVDYHLFSPLDLASVNPELGAHCQSSSAEFQQQQTKGFTDSNKEPSAGYLQRMLNGSTQLKTAPTSLPISRVRIRDPSSVEDRLRDLSISCKTATDPAIDTQSMSPSSSSSVAFGLSSNDSNCSSSSSSSSTAAPQHGPSNKMRTSLAMNGSASLTSQQLDAYASVIRTRQNVKT